MNRTSPDYLTAEEASQIDTDLSDMVADTNLSVAITYKAYVSNTYVPATGTNTVTTSDTSLNAIYGKFTNKEIERSEAQLREGDIWFWFPKSDLSDTLTKEDRIVYGSDTYEVIEWFEDTLGKMYRIVARIM